MWPECQRSCIFSWTYFMPCLTQGLLENGSLVATILDSVCIMSKLQGTVSWGQENDGKEIRGKNTCYARW